MLRETLVLSGFFSFSKREDDNHQGRLFMERVGPMNGGGGETCLNDETGEGEVEREGSE